MKLLVVIKSVWPSTLTYFDVFKTFFLTETFKVKLTEIYLTPKDKKMEYHKNPSLGLCYF